MRISLYFLRLSVLIFFVMSPDYVLATTKTHNSTVKNCAGIVIVDTPALESPETIIHKNDTFKFITQYQYDTKNDIGYYCAHGSYCYLANNIKLLNCKISIACDKGTCESDESGMVIYPVN